MHRRSFLKGLRAAALAVMLPLQLTAFGAGGEPAIETPTTVTIEGVAFTFVSSTPEHVSIGGDIQDSLDKFEEVRKMVWRKR